MAIHTVFGGNLQALIDSNEAYTQESVAKAIESTVTSVNGWINRGVQPRRNNIERLKEAFNLTDDDLLSEENGLRTRFNKAKNHFGLPLVASAEPGYLPRGGFAHAGEFSDPDGIEDVLVEVPKSVADNHPEGRVYRVDGDCMNRVYPEGCQLVADPAVEPQNGSAVCMAAESGDVIMRRMYRLAGQLILSPDSFNPEHENMIFDDPDAAPLTYLGTVVWFQAAEEMR